MKYIVFKTGNPHESMFAAAMCSAETVKGISINYDGLKRVDGNKVELDFKLIREKMKHGVKNATQVDDGVEELKTEGEKITKCKCKHKHKYKKMSILSSLTLLQRMLAVSSRLLKSIT